MGLSCECGFEGDLAWYYESPRDYTVLDTLKRKRCESCFKLINIGDLCISFDRFRDPKNDIEERIHGDFVYLANRFMCESCADIFFSLEDLGFCIDLGDSMKALLKEYHTVYLKGK